MPHLPSPVDGASLFYVDYRPPSNITQPGRSQEHTITLIFIHGWPMSHEMYTHLMLPLSQSHGIRCIAPDRRGFGKSDWGSADVTYDTFAADTVAIVRHAGIEGPFVLVGASMGAGESVLVDKLLPNNLRELCVGFVWLGPSLPYPVQTEQNPTAPPRGLWDAIVKGLREDKVGFARASLPGVFGTRPDMGLDLELAPTKLEFFEYQVRQADAMAIERCIQIITERDFTEDLKAIKKPCLVLHGDGDQGMPASASANIIKTLIPPPYCNVKMYQKAAHGLYLTHAEQVLEDLLGFLSEVER